MTINRAKSTQCAIDSAKLGNVDGVVDQTGKTVTFTVPADTEDSAVATLPLTFTCSQYASIKLKDAEADWVNDTACGMKLNEEKTFVVTKMAFDDGIFIIPVIPPACAPQDTLVRVALMATHTKEQVDYAVEKLTKCFRELGIIK